MDKYFGLEKEDFKRIIGDLIEQNEILKENARKIEEKKKQELKTFEVFRSLEDKMDCDDLCEH